MVEMAVYDFLANLKGGGARNNLFRVVLSFPVFSIATGEESKTLSFLCSASNLPASTVASLSVPFRGRNVKVPGDRSFENWKITVLNDVDFQLRNAFERWMNEINQHRANHGPNNPQAIMSSAKIDQLDREGAIIKTYSMVGIWPSSVAALEVKYGEGAIEEFDATLEYQFWEADTTT